MARIIDIVRARKAEIATNPTKAETTGDLGLAAILAGINKPDGTPTAAWEAYMRHFPGLDTAQLNRLLATDGTSGDKDLDRKRGYVVANGMCGINSPMTQNLDFRVNTIDAGLADCDPENAL